MRPPFTSRGRDDREEPRAERDDLPTREELLAALAESERRLSPGAAARRPAVDEREDRGTDDRRTAAGTGELAEGGNDRRRGLAGNGERGEPVDGPLRPPVEPGERADGGENLRRQVAETGDRAAGRRHPAGRDERRRPDGEVERRGSGDDRDRSPQRGDTTRGGRGNRARRGAVRAAALALLVERPMHGYEIMQELAERTNGAWRPSPGAVYPALSLLQQEGLIAGEGRAGRRAFSLTDAGRAEAEKLTATGTVPWAELVEDQEPAGTSGGMQESYERLGEAVSQLSRVGSVDQKATAATRLTELRREIYLMLAGEAI